MEDFSRREFFKKFVPRPKSNAEAAPVPKTSGPTKQPTLSRRQFVKFPGAMGANVA